MTRAVRTFALLHLAAAILGTVPLLWFLPDLEPAALAGGAGAILAALWLTGAVMQGRVRVRHAIALETLALGVVLAV